MQCADRFSCQGSCSQNAARLFLVALFFSTAAATILVYCTRSSCSQFSGTASPSDQLIDQGAGG